MRLWFPWGSLGSLGFFELLWALKGPLGFLGVPRVFLGFLGEAWVFLRGLGFFELLQASREAFGFLGIP